MQTNAGRESMKSHAMAAIIAGTAIIGAPCFTSSASAQPMNQTSSSGSYLVPVIVGAAAGATVGALIWPAMVPAAATTAVAAAPAATEWGWGAFYTTRAAVGAIIGGGLGYIAAR
jgi:hypothetical protein